jgi:hypothetical protein
MSRGIGYTQRGVLAALRRFQFMSTIELANAIYRGNNLSREPATPAELRSVQRAAQKLAAAGLIRRSKIAVTGHLTWELKS